MNNRYTDLTRYFVEELHLEIKMTERDIAKEIGVSQYTVHKDLQSAMSKLKKVIENEQENTSTM